MKKLLLASLTLALLLSSIGCTGDNMEEEIIECYAGYGYTGTIAEVVNVGDNPDTEFVEGSLVIEVADDNLGAIIVYLTDDMSLKSIENYKAGDSLEFMMDHELNFDSAKDLLHVSPLNLFKVENK
jgi:hypothetical protein